MTDEQQEIMLRYRRALHEIAEEWAGAECGEPVHAQEAYAIGLAKRMYALAVEGLRGSHRARAALAAQPPVNLVQGLNDTNTELDADVALLAWVLAHPETCAEVLREAAAGEGESRALLERRRDALLRHNDRAKPGATVLRCDSA